MAFSNVHIHHKTTLNHINQYNTAFHWFDNLVSGSTKKQKNTLIDLLNS
jgi:hypothetical protein